MKLLLKTASEELANSYHKKAQAEFGALYVYRFQYRANDGKFYYEILLKERESRQYFNPVVGTIYKNHGYGRWQDNPENVYKCIKNLGEYDAVIQNQISGWQFLAHGCGIYDDGSIDWNYSSGGSFAAIE